MNPQPADELSILIVQTQKTIERLLADRDALRAFDPRLAGGEMPFDRDEAEAVYGQMIDAAQRTLDTLRVAAGRVGPA